MYVICRTPAELTLEICGDGTPPNRLWLDHVWIMSISSSGIFVLRKSDRSPVTPPGGGIRMPTVLELEGRTKPTRSLVASKVND